jgi:hypothetical protein
MSPCLVQQLFRQKIGQELDSNLVDDVLFPLLRQRKHGPKDLLQDIKLATDTLIITRQARHFSVPTFTPIPEYWTYVAQVEAAIGGLRALGRSALLQLGGVSEQKVGAYPPVGQRTSKVRRKKIPNEDWGTIDILNELRGLNYPPVGYKPRPYVIEEPDSFDDAFISLSEDNSLPALLARSDVDHSRANAVLIDGRSQFVNNFLDDVLLTDKRLTWSGSPQGGMPWGILSIVESSQHGEVQRQLN